MFCLLDKPLGITSFKFIQKFAKENDIRKIGHTGTLDPMATGLLLVATDDDTKLIEYIDKGFKSYKVRMKLGYLSNTYDIEGEIKKVEFDKTLDVKKQIIFFNKKTYLQTPPIFSAKKINGQRAYDLARRGEFVSLKKVAVTIKNISNINKKTVNEWEFVVIVSRGTYIRSLVMDIANRLGTSAYLTYLRRITIGKLTEKDLNNKIDITRILSIPTIEIKEWKKILNGQTISINKKDGLFALKINNDIYGIVEVLNNDMRAKKLFGNKFNNL